MGRDSVHLTGLGVDQQVLTNGGFSYRRIPGCGGEIKLQRKV